jgi:hypothetical protein
LRILFVVAAALTLSGCVSSPLEDALATQRAPSKEIRRVIVHDAKDYLIDPRSVRDAEISSVMDAPGGEVQFVCVKANAKDATGGYTGRQTVSIRLVGKYPVGMNPNATACAEPLLRWYPFPELEALKNT